MHLRPRSAAVAMTRSLRKGALISAAAVLVGAVALAGAPAAYADEAPSISANFNDATLGVDPAPGKAVPLYISAQGVVHPKVTIDTSGLRGVATVDTPKGCTASAATITCALPLPGQPLEGLALPVVFHPVHGGKAGAKGTVSVTSSADNAQSVSSSATITLADGVDLAMLSHAGTQQHKVGDSFSIPVSVANVGSKAAVGTMLFLGFDHGLIPDSYRNCTYKDVNSFHTLTCTFPDTLAPGDEVVLKDDTGKDFHATVARDAEKDESVDIEANAIDDGSTMAAKVKAQGKPGTGKALTLTKVNKRAAAARMATDIDSNDNHDSADIEVTNSHFDAAAVGTTVTGAAGVVVKVPVGVKNNGPAALNGEHAQEPPLWFVFTVPTDTTAVGAPDSCAPVIDDGATTGPWGASGGTYYLCVVPTLFMGAGDTATVTFSLKINKVTTGAKGTVSLNDKFADPPIFADDNAADNTADVTVNAAGSGSGGRGSGDSTLPVTGTATGLIAAGGVLVVILGAVLVLLGRRRSARS